MKRYLIFQAHDYMNTVYVGSENSLPECFNTVVEKDFCSIIDTKYGLISRYSCTDYIYYDFPSWNNYRKAYQEASYLVFILTKLGYYKDIRQLLFNKCSRDIKWEEMIKGSEL